MILLQSRRHLILLAALASAPIALFLRASSMVSWRPKVHHLLFAPIHSIQWEASGKRINMTAGGFGKSIPLSLSISSDVLDVESEVPLPLSKNVYVWDYSFKRRYVVSSGGDVDDNQHPGLYSPDYWVELTDARTGKKGERVSSGDVNALSFSPDGARLFAGASSCGQTPAGEEGYWSLYQTRNGKIERTLREDDKPVEAAAWSPDGKWVWFALRGGEVGSVTRDGKPGYRFNLWNSVARDERDVTAFALSADNQTLALATSETTPKSFANSVSLVDARTGRILNAWHPATPVTGFSFAPQGDQLAVADARSVILHPLKSGTSRTLPVTGVTVLAFSPDGSRLALGTSKGEIQTWRIK